MAGKGQRGFAAMDPAKQRAIASKGGRASHQKGTAHEFTQEEARVAGRKGGKISHQRGTAHRFTSEEARAAGRKGGEHSRRQMQPAPETYAPLATEQPPTGSPMLPLPESQSQEESQREMEPLEATA